MARNFRGSISTAALAIAVAIAGGAPTAAAESAIAAAAADESPIDQILITASRNDAFDIGGSVQRLDSEQLEKMRYSDVNRVLRAVPGVLIQEEEGFGLRPNIGIRGSGSDRSARVAIMEDGVLVAPAPYAAPAAYYFPRIARISAVEVAKGPAAIKYGPLTTGGTVALLSSPIPASTRADGLAGRATVLGGNFGQLRALGALGGWFGVGGGVEAGILVEGLHERSSGFKQLDAGPGVPTGTGYNIDDMVVKLGVRSVDGVHSVEVKFQRYAERSDETYLGLTRADFLATPLRRYAASQVDVMNVRQDFWQASYRLAPTEAFSLAATAYVRDTSRAWYKLHDVRNLANTGWTSLSNVLLTPAAFPTELADLRGGDGFAGRVGALRVRNNNREYAARGVQLLAESRFATGRVDHKLEASLRFHRDSEDRFQQDDRYTMVGRTMELVSVGVPGSQDNRLGEARAWSAFVRDTMTVGPLTLTPGVRYENIILRQTRWALGDAVRAVPVAQAERSVQAWLPGVGAVWRVSDGLRLVGGVHRGFSNPAPGSTTTAETSWNYEAGVRLGSPAQGLEIIGFVNQFGNLVGTCTASTDSGCAIGDQFDGGRARTRGVEVLGHVRVGDVAERGFAVPLSLSYTLLDARFQTSFVSGFGPWGTVTAGDRLPYVPSSQISLTAGVELPRFAANLVVNGVTATRNRAGPGPIADGNRIDGRVVADLSVSYDVLAGVQLFGSVTNVTDARFNVALLPAGFRPGMPRAVLLGAKLGF